MTINHEDILLTANDVCAILRISHNKFYELVRKKKISAFRLDHHSRKDKYNRHPWRVKISDLNNYIEGIDTIASKE